MIDLIGISWCSGLISFILSFILPPRANYQGSLKHFLISFFIHFSLIDLGFAIILFISERVIFSLAITLALTLILEIINFAKYLNLKEPLVFSDYDYIVDAFRFPRLYFPFLGFAGFMGIALATFVVAYSYYLDQPYDRFELDGILGNFIFNIIFSSFILYVLKRFKGYDCTFDVQYDYVQKGLLPLLWCYGIYYFKKPLVKSPFEYAKSANFQEQDCNSTSSLATNLEFSDTSEKISKELPIIVAVQSESFFDPRLWLPNIKSSVLQELDLTKENALFYDQITVPAYGANTIRSEFAFLTGIEAKDLQIHRFSPYQTVFHHWKVLNIVKVLKDLGYITVCVHPYFKKFYHRDQIFKEWGFDYFYDIEYFKSLEEPKKREHRSNQKIDNHLYCGPYISDKTMADVISDLIDQHLEKKLGKPLFVFAITMENHGPLHLEHITEKDCQEYFESSLDQNFDFENLKEVGIYLRHLKNADQMIKTIKAKLSSLNCNASLIMYGDHVPILPKAYKKYGDPNGDVPCFVWNNKRLQDLFRSTITRISENEEQSLVAPFDQFRSKEEILDFLDLLNKSKSDNLIEKELVDYITDRLRKLNRSNIELSSISIFYYLIIQTMRISHK